MGEMHLSGGPVCLVVEEGGRICGSAAGDFGTLCPDHAKLRKLSNFETTVCTYRGIGKPPSPPACTNPAPDYPFSGYCDEHRCWFLTSDDSRCPDRKAEGERYCTQHTLTAAIASGLGKEAPTVVAANGAKQSHAPYAFTSIDPLALFRVAEIQKGGDDKYGPDNWRRLPTEDHINHALSHIYGHLAGDTSDDHLGHAATRLLFALATYLRPDFHGKDTQEDDAD